MVTEVNYWDHDFFKGTAAVAEMEALRASAISSDTSTSGAASTTSCPQSKVFENVAIGRPEGGGLDELRAALWSRFWLQRSDGRGALPFPAREPRRSTSPPKPTPRASPSTCCPNSSTWSCTDAATSSGPTAQARAPSSSWNRAATACAGVKKSKGSVQDGVQRMQNYKLLVDPDCPETQRELHSYSWPTDRLTGMVITGMNPVGGADHIVDAIRYATTNVLADDTADDDGGVLTFRLW